MPIDLRYVLTFLFCVCKTNQSLCLPLCLLVLCSPLTLRAGLCLPLLACLCFCLPYLTVPWLAFACIGLRLNADGIEEINKCIFCSTSGSAHFWHARHLPRATSCNKTSARMTIHGLQRIWPWELDKCIFVPILDHQSDPINQTRSTRSDQSNEIKTGMPWLCLPCLALAYGVHFKKCWWTWGTHFLFFYLLYL